MIATLLIKKYQVALITLSIVCLSLLIAEFYGWPFLMQPFEQMLSKRLGKKVSFCLDKEMSCRTNAGKTNQFQVRFMGGLSFQTPYLEVAAPAWSKAPYLIQAKDVKVKLRYIDLWHAYRTFSNKPWDATHPLQVNFFNIKSLSANWLGAYLEVLSDGRVSWQLAEKNHSMSFIPMFNQLQIEKGYIEYHDSLRKLNLITHLSLVNKAVPNQLSFSASTPNNPSNIKKSNTIDHQPSLSIQSKGDY